MFVEEKITSEMHKKYIIYYSMQFFFHFNSAITSVSPLMGEDRDQWQWEVVVTNVDTKESQVHVFEAVIVCSGYVF